MKRSRKRIMSVILAFSIVFGSVGYAFAQEHNAVETNDPFAGMVSWHLDYTTVSYKAENVLF